MVNISKKRLQKKTKEKIHQRLLKTVIDLRGKNGKQFLQEFFTDAEQLMIAKRLAALLLLAEGATSYRVHKVLKISPTTAATLKHGLDAGRYAHIEVLVGKKRSRDKVWKDLEAIVRLGMPELGRGRWKRLDDIFSPR